MPWTEAPCRRLETLFLDSAAIGDAGLAALAPALRRRPALEDLFLCGNPFGDEGLAALVAPPPPAAGTPATAAAGGLRKLELLDLDSNPVTAAGCATLVAAIDSGALPALEVLDLEDINASAAAQEAVRAAIARSRHRVLRG